MNSPRCFKVVALAVMVPVLAGCHRPPRPGPGGHSVVALVGWSSAEGYRRLVGTSGPLAINPSLDKTTGFDPLRDFAPVILAASAPFVIVLNPSVAAGNVKELIALATAKPGQINYGSVQGNAEPLGTAVFSYMEGTKKHAVYYQGEAQADSDGIQGAIEIEH